MRFKGALWVGWIALAGGGAAAAQPAMPQQTSMWQNKARSLFERVIAMRTVAGAGQVPAMAEYLASEFRQAGFPSPDIKIIPVEETAALVVRFRASAPAGGEKPILLLAHMDVVDARISEWSADPFQLREEDGYLYGRGTNDNKSGLVAITTAFLRLKAEGFRPRRDLILAFTGDEETTMKSARLLANRHRDLVDAEFALNSDAGYGAFDRSGRSLGFAFQTGEKTSTTFYLTTVNPGGHSARPRPDNAIYQLSSALMKIAGHRFDPMADDTTRAYFEAVADQYEGAAAEAMRRFSRNPSDREAAAMIEQQAGEIGTTRTTCVATEIGGGHAFNALPQTARATVNCRIFPGQSPAEVQAVLERVVGDPGVTFTISDQKTIAPSSPLRADVLDAYRRAVRARFPDAKVIPRMLSGMTDGAEFRAAGIPTYGVDGSWVVVPDDLRLHGRDERIAVEAFNANLDHWTLMLRDLAGR